MLPHLKCATPSETIKYAERGILKSVVSMIWRYRKWSINRHERLFNFSTFRVVHIFGLGGWLKLKKKSFFFCLRKFVRTEKFKENFCIRNTMLHRQKLVAKNHTHARFIFQA